MSCMERFDGGGGEVVTIEPWSWVGWLGRLGEFLRWFLDCAIMRCLSALAFEICATTYLPTEYGVKWAGGRGGGVAGEHIGSHISIS